MLPAYESMLEIFYTSFLKPGDIVIDVGAHNGRHSLPMADKVSPSGNIHCFEPLPIQFNNICSLVEDRGKGDIIFTYNCALGETNGKTTFTHVPDFPEYSGFKERQYHDDDIQRNVIPVDVKTLDSFLMEFSSLRFIKIDTEGAELSVLRGGRQLIAKTRPIISFELGNSSLINYEYTAHDYFSFFSDLGYKIFTIFGLEVTEDQFVEFSAIQFFWDYIALPREAEWPAGHSPIRLLIDQLSAVPA